MQRKVTRNGSQWAIVSVEDLSGAIDALFFPQIYTAVGHALTEDAVVVVRGGLNRRDEIPTDLRGRAHPARPHPGRGRRPVVLSVDVHRCTPPRVEQLKEVLAAAPGATEVHLRPTQTGRSTVMRLDDGLR